MNFIEKSNIIHDNRYDYSKVSYINMKTKIEIICSIHGSFLQTPSNHLYCKQGCPNCANNIQSTTEEFIIKSNSIHNNLYNYSKVNYINNHTKVEIICDTHGSFFQNPQNHIHSKQGCKLCSGNILLSTLQIIEKSNSVHNNLYDYSKVNYINNNTTIEIICKTHGIFSQLPTNHIYKKAGCPHCKNSKGANIIRDYLINNNIEFYQEKSFNDCKSKYVLRFDFYLPKYNLCLEFDGEQHFKPILYFGGDKDFLKIVERDLIKTKYCSDNNIELLRISYLEINKIEKIMDNYFKDKD